MAGRKNIVTWPTKKLGKIYLIGVSHNVQWDRSLTRTQGFISYLKQHTEELKPDLIVEEFSKEAREKNNIASTTTQDIAEQYGTKHKFCDPDSQQRKGLGIPSHKEIKSSLGISGPVIVSSLQDKQIQEEQRKYHRIKEQFCVDQIKDEIFANAIFICGSDHLESFKSLLEKYKYEVSVLKNYG